MVVRTQQKRLRIGASRVKRAGRAGRAGTDTSGVNVVKLPGSTSFICSWSCSASPCNCGSKEVGREVMRSTRVRGKTTRGGR